MRLGWGAVPLARFVEPKPFFVKLEVVLVQCQTRGENPKCHKFLKR